METTRYLCEFFFCNFWHWLGLVVCLTLVCGCISSVFENIFNAFRRN